MKTRNSFVSNSSSTSFIIALRDQSKCSKCGMSPQTLTDLLISMSEESEDINEVEEDLKERLEETRRESGKYWRDWVARTQNVLNEIWKRRMAGEKVYHIELSYHDNKSRQLLKLLIDQRYVEVIDEENE